MRPNFRPNFSSFYNLEESRNLIRFARNVSHRNFPRRLSFAGSDSRHGFFSIEGEREREK